MSLDDYETIYEDDYVELKRKEGDYILDHKIAWTLLSLTKNKVKRHLRFYQQWKIVYEDEVIRFMKNVKHEGAYALFNKITQDLYVAHVIADEQGLLD